MVNRNRIFLKSIKNKKQFLINFLAGPSSSGKSSWTIALIKNRNEMFDEIINSVVIISPHKQPEYDSLIKDGIATKLYEDLPNYDEILEMAKYHKDKGGFLLVLDDVLGDLDNDTRIQQIFTELCHHYKVTCILCVQNLFYRNTIYRTLSLNSSYIVVFKNARDQRQITTLASQSYPHKPAYLIQSFMNATKDPHSYLLIDYRQVCNI